MVPPVLIDKNNDGVKDILMSSFNGWMILYWETLFSCSTQQSLKFILLINVKMPTIVGILTFINRIND